MNQYKPSFHHDQSLYQPPISPAFHHTFYHILTKIFTTHAELLPDLPWHQEHGANGIDGFVPGDHHLRIFSMNRRDLMVNHGETSGLIFVDND